MDFKINLGDIVRYGKGISAIMKIESINNLRVYGTHILGGSVGACKNDLSLAKKTDIELWQDKYAERNQHDK